MGVCTPCRMIRDGHYKMTYVHGHESLLFDLAADPLEHHDLSGQPQVAAIERKLSAALLEGWDPEVINARVLESQAARRVIWSATKDDTGDNWSYDFRKGDQQRFVRGGGTGAGTVAVKGRARYPYVEPLPLADARPIPDCWK